MKTQAAVLYELAQPAPYADSRPLHVEEVELTGPGAGEVLVEIAGAGLCHSDLSVVDGTLRRPLPIVLGHEAAGIVRETGPGVTDFQPDDHVVFSFVPMCGRCEYCMTGRPALCERGTKTLREGCLMNGSRHFHAGGQILHHHLGVSAFSRYTVVAQESLIQIDLAIPLGKAALFGCAVLTGVGSVVNTAHVEAGASVAVFGLGGVGLSAVMGAALSGAWPIIAVDLLAEKLDLAKELGATYVVDADAEDAVDTIRDLTGGGAQYTVEAVGNEQVLEQAYRATRRGGTTITIGLPSPQKRFSLSAFNVVAEERTIKGSFMGSAVPKRDIPRYMALYQAGQLPVDKLLTRNISLQDINEGFDALALGKAVRQVIEFQSQHGESANE